uniref:Uncharacterized protein n=1 Tax=Rhizophora mucronata TaxID=61149 RepID=A0A2P2PH70_RHIMU
MRLSADNCGIGRSLFE